MHSSHGSTRWGVIVCLVLLILSATTFAEDYTYNFSLAPLRDGCGDGEELQLVNDVVYTAFLKHLSTLESATTPVLLSKAVFDPRKKGYFSVRWDSIVGKKLFDHDKVDTFYCPFPQNTRVTVDDEVDEDGQVCVSLAVVQERMLLQDGTLIQPRSEDGCTSVAQASQKLMLTILPPGSTFTMWCVQRILVTTTSSTTTTKKPVQPPADSSSSDVSEDKPTDSSSSHKGTAGDSSSSHKGKESSDKGTADSSSSTHSDGGKAGTDNTRNEEKGGGGFPGWAVAIIVIGIILVAAAVFLILFFCCGCFRCWCCAEDDDDDSSDGSSETRTVKSLTSETNMLLTHGCRGTQHLRRRQRSIAGRMSGDYMTEDESLRLHLLRHKGTADPEYGPFINSDSDDSDSDDDSDTTSEFSSTCTSSGGSDSTYESSTNSSRRRY